MNFPWIILGGLTLIRLLIGALGHFSEIESYLILCSHHLSWGFIDQAPGIPALIRVVDLLLGASPFAVRCLSSVLLLGLSWILWRWTLAISSRQGAFWAVITLNVLPLVNAASVVMEGAMVGAFFWMMALFSAWRLVTIQHERNRFSVWFVFGLILAMGTQVSYSIGWLFPLMMLAIANVFQYQLFLPKKVVAISRAWEKSAAILLVLGLLALSWLPLIFWNQQHDGLLFQNRTWDSFWSWPPVSGDYFRHLPVAWALCSIIPLLIGILSCFSGKWNLEHPFFLIAVVPFFFCMNDLIHGEAPFALMLVITMLFIPIAVDALIQSVKGKVTGGIVLFGSACISLALLFGKMDSSTLQNSVWNFPSAGGVTGVDSIVEQLTKLREIYASTSKTPPFLIAETPGLAALLGAVLPFHYPECPEAPSVFVPESPAFTSQFQLWPNYANATQENVTPDPLYTEEKMVSPFLGKDALYITTEKLEEIPQTITASFASLVPLSCTLSFKKNGTLEQLNVYLCQSYQMMSF